MQKLKTFKTLSFHNSDKNPSKPIISYDHIIIQQKIKELEKGEFENHLRFTENSKFRSWGDPEPDSRELCHQSFGAVQFRTREKKRNRVITIIKRC